jgi:hypothetical protein
MTTESASLGDRAGEARGFRSGHSAAAQLIAGWRWVRLAHIDQPRYFVMLKMSPHADEDDAVRALEWWLQSPGREEMGTSWRSVDRLRPVAADSRSATIQARRQP